MPVLLYFCDMKQNKITLYIDLLFCVVFLPMLIKILPVDKWIVHQTTFLLILVAYLYILYFVYRKVKIPSLMMRKKYGRVVMIIILLLAATELVSLVPFTENSSQSPLPQATRQHLRSQTVWFFFWVVTGFALAIELLFELFRQIISKHEIEAEKDKAELSLYKSQINPHFLFNTLNSLYALVISQSEHTETAFIKFSNILKYMYSQATSDYIDIGSEINYIRQYVDLQKLRLNHHTTIDFVSEIDNDKMMIPPMILITFVENAFKYGSSSDEDCCISIRIKVSNGVLDFETKNKIMRDRNDIVSAVGIENCRKRLELLYPDKFKLSAGYNGEMYETRLVINLL